jgi:hypothetical protein
MFNIFKTTLNHLKIRDSQKKFQLLEYQTSLLNPRVCLYFREKGLSLEGEKWLSGGAANGAGGLCPPPPSYIVKKRPCKMLEVSIFKALGLDDIPNRVIKDFAYELAYPVCTIFNTSLSSGEVPLM